jgi:hypothetical protein
MVANVMPRKLTYIIWEADKLGTEGVKRYICFRMFALADDQTMLTLRQSAFMYGFFKTDGPDLTVTSDQGVACWYAVLTEETREQAELWMAGAKFS